MKYDRKDFPFFQKMPIKVDVDALKQELQVLETRNNWLDINPETKYYQALLKGRKHLLDAFSDDEGGFSTYHQIVLTEFNKESYSGIAEQTVDEIAASAEDRKYSRYKRDVLEIMAGQNEKNYGKFRDLISDMPSIQSLLTSFKNPVTRARFAKLNAGADIKAHIDNNVGYGVRYHLALETNPDCYLLVRRSPTHEYEKFHVPVDGHLYYLNVGFEHYAVNGGDTDRVHLVIGVNGLDDLLPFTK